MTRSKVIYLNSSMINSQDIRRFGLRRFISSGKHRWTEVCYVFVDVQVYLQPSFMSSRVLKSVLTESEKRRLFCLMVVNPLNISFFT